jgi:glycosyltransferase involved in cell wall biosynthesis
VPSPELVSIGMPVRNEARHLAEAVASLRAQTWPDWELTISDNASTDGTEEIARSLAAGDERIRYERLPADVGPRENWNRVARGARGACFFWAPGHDRWRPEFIAACLEALRDAPPPARLGRTAASGDAAVVLAHPLAAGLDEVGAPIAVHNSRLDTRGLRAERRFLATLFGLAAALPIHGLIRTDALRRTGLMGANVGPEYPLLAELALQGAFAHVPQTLFEYRQVREESAAAFTRRTLSAWQQRRPRQLVVSPEWELLRAHARVLRRAPLPARTKALLAPCLAVYALDRLGARGLRTTWLRG